MTTASPITRKPYSDRCSDVDITLSRPIATQTTRLCPETSNSSHEYILFLRSINKLVRLDIFRIWAQEQGSFEF